MTDYGECLFLSALPDELFPAVHQTECIITMVTLIAGPHFTLEGPDSFLQSSALPVTGCIVLWNTDRAFFFQMTLCLVHYAPRCSSLQSKRMPRSKQSRLYK